MFTNILFEKHSRVALNKIVKEMQQDYSKKKGDRFNVEGITYEIGNLTVKEKIICFEVSSKIPEDNVPEDKHDDYYKQVIKAIEKKGKVFDEAHMEGIVKAKDSEQKRDYVKLIYRINADTIIDLDEVVKNVESGKVDVPAEEVAKHVSATSLIGKYVIHYYEKNAHDLFKAEIQKMIDANEATRKKY